MKAFANADTLPRTVRIALSTSPDPPMNTTDPGPVRLTQFSHDRAAMIGGITPGPSRVIVR